MPTSSHLGKLYTTMMLKKLHEAVSIRNVVDFGCGEGTYRRLLGPHLPGARWTGIEVWQPYVDQFDLRSQYDSLIVQDCRSVDCLALAPVDLAIFGDILEHMTGDEAASVVERALAVAPLVVISIPVVHFPQGPTGAIHMKRTSRTTGTITRSCEPFLASAPSSFMTILESIFSLEPRCCPGR